MAMNDELKTGCYVLVRCGDLQSSFFFFLLYSMDVKYLCTRERWPCLDV